MTPPDTRQEDLDDCADEPIRIPGAIQPHGLLAWVGPDFSLKAFSANWPSQASVDEALRDIAPSAKSLVEGEAPRFLVRYRFADKVVDVTAHVRDGNTIFEFEEPSATQNFDVPIYALARRALPELQGAEFLEDVVIAAVRQLKALTKFGRCLLYRFDQNGHGEVLAEELDDGYDSYAGHHFPASDIPMQARALYLQNQIRLIPNADYVPVPLVAASKDIDASKLDLTFASLRSVSPIHAEYMRNMGTLASMSVSLVIKDRLWGLISCHDHDPKFLDVQTRIACEHLGRLAAMQIDSKLATSEVAKRLELRHMTARLVSAMSDSDASLRSLVEHRELLELTGATGAVVVLDDACWTVGDTPDQDTIMALAAWVSAMPDSVYSSDSLSEEWSAAKDHLSIASGILAVSLSEVHRHLIIWFRPERVRTIQWAGEPRKILEKGRVHPRKSFRSWEETVRGKSTPWTDAERNAAEELRRALLEIVLKRAEELAEIATELKRVNKELEAFSYTVSHDLRAPMRHIAGYVDLVLGSSEAKLDSEELRYLRHVKEAAAYSGQLVDSLLEFSRLGRTSLKQIDVETGALVEKVVEDHQRAIAGRNVDWNIDDHLPRVRADAFLLEVVIRNLISNAVKYTGNKPKAHISIRAISTDAGEGLEVSDDGVGFDMRYANKLFGVFQRLHSSDDYEGTGIGLATLKRIVERHGGQVWARGKPNEGATFGFTVPRTGSESESVKGK